MNNPLVSCVLRQEVEVLQNMLNKNISSINKEDMLNASAYAASINAPDIVKLFISNGLHISDILTKAVKYSFTNAIDVLHKMNADINHEHNGYTLITLAAVQHSTECMEKLLHNGAQLNLKTKKGETCLTWISRHSDDYSNELQYLVTKGADINLSNNKGQTPLHIAAEYTNAHTLHSLLSLGAHINFQDKYGETALMIASGNHDNESVLVLLQYGAEIDLQLLWGDTALTKYIKNIYHEESSYETIDLLLKNNCNTNISDNGGQTPLHLAIQVKEKIITSKLLSFRANILTETACGITPFLASIIIGDDKLAAQFIDMQCYVSKCNTNQDWKQYAKPMRQIATMLSPNFNRLNSESLNQLFFGAGETYPIGYIYQPHMIAIIAMKRNHETLMMITRHAIRSYLLKLNCVNLITQITKLPLPINLKKILYFL